MADFGAFLSNIALGAGRNMQYSQQQEERQAALDDQKSQTATRLENSKLQRDEFVQRSGIAEQQAKAAAQKKANAENIFNTIKTRDTVENSPVQTAEAEAEMFGKRAEAFYKSGDFVAGKAMADQAEVKTKDAERLQKTVKERKADRVEAVGAAAEDVLTAMNKGGLTPDMMNNYLKTTAEAGMPSASMGGTGFGKDNQPGASGYDLTSEKGKMELILAANKSKEVRKLRESESKMTNDDARIKETHERNQQLAEATRENARLKAERQAGSKIEMSDDEVKSAGAQAARGVPLSQIVSGTRAESSMAREKVRAEGIRQIREENPGLDAIGAGTLMADIGIAFKAQTAASTAAARTAGTTVTNLDIAGDEARSMIDVSRKYLAPADTGRFKTLNEFENYANTHTGDKNVVQLKASLNSLANSYARAISPKGVSTVSDKEHAREVMSQGFSKGQLGGVFDVLGEEMNAAHKAASGVLGRVTATPGAKGGVKGGEVMSLDDYLKQHGG